MYTFNTGCPPISPQPAWKRVMCVCDAAGAGVWRLRCECGTQCQGAGPNCRDQRRNCSCLWGDPSSGPAVLLHRGVWGRSSGGGPAHLGLSEPQASPTIRTSSFTHHMPMHEGGLGMSPAHELFRSSCFACHLTLDTWLAHASILFLSLSFDEGFANCLCS